MRRPFPISSIRFRPRPPDPLPRPGPKPPEGPKRQNPCRSGFEPDHSALERVAHVVIPVRHAAEKSGHFTNHAGLVQAVSPAVEPAGDALAEAEAFDRIAAALTAGEDAA